MVLRTNWLIALGSVLAGLVGLVAIATSASTSPRIHADGRAIAIIVALAAALAIARLVRAGLTLKPNEIVVRGLSTTTRLDRHDVLGLSLQALPFSRWRRVAVVCTDGRVVPAVWTVFGPENFETPNLAVRAAYGFGPTQPQVLPTLTGHRRLAVHSAGDPIPTATSDPGLTPDNVGPVINPETNKWLGWETIFVVTAFALPGVAGAVEILAKHLGGAGDLNEFDLPLPHNPSVSLIVLILGYLTTALVVPIALLLLARTGQPPASLGLERQGLFQDARRAVWLLGGVFAANAVFALIFSSFLSDTEKNSHVPAYYIIYALTVAATTAINEEVLVNGYFLTRLSQRGWSPRQALALSLAVRTSYHVYYGLGFLGTVPFGYLVTRSFQKRGRLARPIITHFLYDAILLTIAVLAS